MKKEHQWAIGAAVIGILAYHFLAFSLVYQNQPHDFNCNRAETLCELGNGIDTTPYAACDSCCPDVPDTCTDTCTGVNTPYTSMSQSTLADNFCANLECPTGTCHANWIDNIARIGWQCGC